MSNLFFEILGVNRKSTKDEIRKAHRKLIKRWHPDKFPADTKEQLAATEKTKLINRAWEVLKNYEPLLAESQKDYAPPSARRESEKSSRQIERTRVKSSNIYSIGYSVNEMVLQIEFINGNIYEYFEVPESIFIRFMKAESKGKFANGNIYFSYHYKRIR